jgi:hypothetical protein
MTYKMIPFYIIAIATICFLQSPAQAQTTREYPYLYKSPRAMGMGGAYTAVGGRTDTLFYNPAGLSNIPKDKGWEFSLLDLSAEVSKNSLDFYDDLQDATDVGDLNGDGSADDDEQKAVNDVLAQYMGENIHLRAADFTAMGKSWARFSFGIGGIGSARVDAIAHQGFSSEGMLEMNSDVTYGGIAGFSFGLTEKLFIGITAKALNRESVIHNFTARELVEHQDDMDDYITDTLKKSGSAVGFDAGMIWNLAPDSWWRPSIGISALNIGDLDFKEAGMIPMTINAGIAANPRITWFRNLIIAADYVDITNNFTEDADTAKRIRYGAELQLFDKLPVELALRAGMYEGAPTFGADFRLLVFKLSYTMYSEEMGAYAGQDKDKRQMLTLNVGW